MTSKKTTKRALLMSALALVMCMAMLIGSTFAWFTDSVTSSGNKIVSGKLEVDLLMGTAVDTYHSIANQDAAIFGANSLVAQNNAADTLWEPGKTQIVYLGVENKGNLALKYNIMLDVIDGGLIGALEYAIIDGAKFGDITAADWAAIKNNAAAQTGDVAAGTTVAAPNGAIEAAAAGQRAVDYFALAVHMKEDAGNEYQNKDITIDVAVVATQLASEEDVFDSQYDKLATFPAVNSVKVESGRTEDVSVSAGAVTVDVPTTADAGKYALTVENTSVTENADGTQTANFDITLTNDGVELDTAVPGVEYTVTVKVASGINPATVKVLHKGVEVANPVADPVKGTVTFKTSSFSPYSIIYTVDCDLFTEQDKNGVKTHYVITADGFAQLNQMMQNKTAGQYAKVKLCANIDMAGKTWTPVDSHADTAFFISEFDGQGYTISNLTINGQAMFTRFAGFGDVTIKNVTFDKTNVNNSSINTSILTGQTYQNVLLDNVDVTNSTIKGGYKVAPLIATVYDEKATSITATIKNCDVSNTEVIATQFDFFTCGMVAFVYTTNNDYVEYENCSITDVALKAVSGVYNYHANIHYTSADTDDQINEASGVTVTNVTFENL